MGNCLRNPKVSSVQDHENYQTPLEAKIEKINTSTSSDLKAPHREQRAKKAKKKVKFKIEGEDEGDGGIQGDSKSGVVRIRLMMTQEDLKRMTSYKDETSLDQLLEVVKLRGGRIFEVKESDGGINSWRPALESIPEDRLIK